MSAIGILVLIGSFFFKRSRKHWIAPASLAVILMGATIGPAYLDHFEVRYLFSVKLIGLIVIYSASGFGMNYLISKFRNQRKSQKIVDIS